MVLGKSMPDLKGAKEKAAGMAGSAMEKMNEMVDEFKKAMKVFEQFGFRTDKFKVDMGAIPSISTSVSGSLEKVKVDGLQKLMEEHADNKLLVTMLDALVKAKKLRDRVEINYFTGAKLNIKLGIPPTISFGLKEIK